MRPVAAIVCVVALIAAGCDRAANDDAPAVRGLRIFHAAGLSPVLEALREGALADLRLDLLAEPSGSQVACRKVADLNRTCDLVMVADAALVAELLPNDCSWRLDFATDEMALGVGIRAPHVPEAERDWPRVLLSPDVRFGRVREDLAPVGYRALLVAELQEKSDGPAGLGEALVKKADVVVDDVARLTPLLKTGEIDYAFVYRSICIAHDVRFIPLEAKVNLGDADVDYSAASVTFPKSHGLDETVTIAGAPITWALSVPRTAFPADDALAFVEYLVAHRELLAAHGFRPISPPRFYGPASAFAPLADYATKSGDRP